MTPEGYYAAVKDLGLTPSDVPGVFIDREGMTCSVPSPYTMTPDQRDETFARIRERIRLLRRT
jgi:hypothetical protein